MKAFADESTADERRLAERVVEVAAQVVQLVRAEVRQSRERGKAYSQIRALRFLKSKPGAALSEVADGLGLGAPTVSKVINELVELGMVRRTEDCVDRRKVVLKLTEQGTEALREASEVAHAGIARQLSPLAAEERAAVARAVGLLEPLFVD